MNNVNNSYITNLMYLPIPANWKLFENMCQEVLGTELKLNFQPYGRSGQNQYGIDLFAPITPEEIIVVQCKNFFSKISIKIIGSELAKFKNIPIENTIKITRYIFATTAPTDNNIQNYILTLNAERAKKNECPVEVVFWEHFIPIILSNNDIFYRYYNYLSPSPSNPYILIELVFWYSNLSNHCLVLLDEVPCNTILSYLYNSKIYFSRNINLLERYNWCIESLLHELNNFDMTAVNLESTSLYMSCRNIEDLIKELPSVLNEKELIYFQISNLLACLDLNASSNENFKISTSNKELFLNYIQKLTNNENIIKHLEIKIDKFDNKNYRGYTYIYSIIEDIKKYIPIF
ncbi:hypothetical protein ACJDU8_11090 [Clostridium sp. WILCCON 0269]|uniref:Restriction endonuclease type IV Mrr domain-containing protein n=1 Tax=Candidatus Clostridium eludens TaxID=3381663 RepID=A0ABW8SJ93_9CLOT